MSTQLESTNAVPLYRQLSKLIRTSVECGEYPKGSQIPTESALSEKYGVSRITVRKALDELTEEGLLSRKQGKGTFVSSTVSVNTNYPFMSFDESCRQAGKVPLSVLLSYSMEHASRKTAAFFGIEENAMVIKICRLRSADNEPVILETDYFPASFDFLSSEPLNESTNLILNKHNIFPTHGEAVISIKQADASEAELLKVAEDTSLLYIYSEISDQNDVHISISKQLILSELYSVTLTF